jgi:hypothetical protein
MIACVSVQIPTTNHKNTPQSQKGTAGSYFVKMIAYLSYISGTLVAQTASKNVLFFTTPFSESHYNAEY